MSDTDRKIAEALDDDDYAFLTKLEGDRGLFQQIGDSWHGPLGGWAKLIFGFTFALGMLFLFVVWQVVHTSHPMAHAMWAISGVALLVIIGFAKEWMFARMNMLTILREIKRLQVQVALLSEEKNAD
ncbi:hypothetical protein INR77_06860 [Erythrobacter sp. SCSIO 43205]|uniref:DUF6768 family protein n=1 Tax=Erythrobacter sp. SCSIO 43205 TaxID=2779361 RepID=UPI001CA80B6D|nr:DUF6768 family protein [Erythrobacter sp. SCSIO 43205]UAB79388.1 hypothetical protein INR77_06860 [Erythrobacter sp. SCSIO 43205]